MNETLQFIVILLSSGVIAAIVSGVIQKNSEKETRLFNAKLEAYKEFAAHLASRFVSVIEEGKELNITNLIQISAKCLLVSNSNLNKELKLFLVYVSEIYKKCCENKDEPADYDKLWSEGNKIENLMREDLGFK